MIAVVGIIAIVVGIMFAGSGILGGDRRQAAIGASFAAAGIGIVLAVIL